MSTTEARRGTSGSRALSLHVPRAVGWLEARLSPLTPTHTGGDDSQEGMRKGRGPGSSVRTGPVRTQDAPGDLPEGSDPPLGPGPASTEEGGGI